MGSKLARKTVARYPSITPKSRSVKKIPDKALKTITNTNIKHQPKKLMLAFLGGESARAGRKDRPW